jgi:hypothetical protein
MKLRSLLLAITLGLLPITAMGGSNHDHGQGHNHSHSITPVSQETAIKIATSVVVDFAQRKKVDESWATITSNSVEQKEFNGKLEWVVFFDNDKITDPAKRTIYVFLTLTGDYIAANYSGK